MRYIWLFLSLGPCALFAQHKPLFDTTGTAAKLQWFTDAKLGIFIHWGIYSVKGVGESWSFHNGAMPHADYMQQIKGFTAKHYDPAAWAELIRKSGAKYAVITTKHHDGVALYHTQLVPGGRKKPLSVVAASPCGRDVIAPFFTELRMRDIKCGAYFSLIDWSDPDYPGFLRDSSRYKVADDPARWQRFSTYNQGQIEELCKRFKPDLFWFDGDWEHTAEEWQAAKIRAMILKDNPKAIINGRLQGYGDYATPEQNIPIETPPGPWELCLTSNDNWGWQPQDTVYKSMHDLIAIFADVIGHGGNLLLDIGPKEDGTIPPGQVKLLEEIGQWTGAHAEAIYGTLAGLPNGHFYGPTTLSKDSTTLYLFLPGGTGGSALIKGLDNKILSAEVVGKPIALTHRVVGKISWSKVPGLVFVDVPEEAKDPWMTVLKLKLDGPVKLYRGQGGFN
ncbi:MAG TPA: alpha-L-fucosidase [Flavobacteriales bacterium]|nr:alpha-L-fucosidase [Flavobacteriales bacterium]